PRWHRGMRTSRSATVCCSAHSPARGQRCPSALPLKSGPRLDLFPPLPRFGERGKKRCLLANGEKGMRSWVYYWRRCLWDFLRHNAFCGSQVSKVLARLSHLLRHPFARLSMQCRAARLYPTRRRLLWLRPALETEVAQIDVTPVGLVQP